MQNELHVKSPPFCWGEAFFVSNFKKRWDYKKMTVWGDFKGPCHRYVTEGACYAPCQKRL